jgi:hypothetical protein
MGHLDYILDRLEREFKDSLETALLIKNQTSPDRKPRTFSKDLSNNNEEEKI